MVIAMVMVIVAVMAVSSGFRFETGSLPSRHAFGLLGQCSSLHHARSMARCSLPAGYGRLGTAAAPKKSSWRRRQLSW